MSHCQRFWINVFALMLINSLNSDLICMKEGDFGWKHLQQLQGMVSKNPDGLNTISDVGAARLQDQMDHVKLMLPADYNAVASNCASN